MEVFSASFFQTKNLLHTTKIATSLFQNRYFLKPKIKTLIVKKCGNQKKAFFGSDLDPKRKQGTKIFDQITSILSNLIGIVKLCRSKGLLILKPKNLSVERVSLVVRRRGPPPHLLCIFYHFETT